MEPEDMTPPIGLSQLGAREAADALHHVPPTEGTRIKIPNYYALSLSELRGQQRKAELEPSAPPVPEPPEPSVPSASPFPEPDLMFRADAWDDVATFAELVPRICAALDRIAQNPSALNAAALSALSGRLRAIEFGDPVQRVVAQQRAEGAKWEEIARNLNARIDAGDDRFTPSRSSRWTAVNLRNVKSASVDQGDEEIVTLIEAQRAERVTWEAIARGLNERIDRGDAHLAPPRGGHWSREGVRAYLSRRRRADRRARRLRG
ncbi:MAG: hypothetical protein ACO3O3_04495 [Ilumatobacteraceae bacterium]